MTGAVVTVNGGAEKSFVTFYAAEHWLRAFLIKNPLKPSGPAKKFFQALADSFVACEDFKKTHNKQAITVRWTNSIEGI